MTLRRAPRLGCSSPFAASNLYTCDANGNLLTKADPTLASAAAYGYNKLNQLVSVTTDGTTASYTYNAQGIRTSKLVDGKLTRYLLDGGNVVAEVTDSVVTATYLWGANLISQTIGESTNYYLYNAHGDVVQLTDSAGTVIQSYPYDAFGNETDPDETDTNPFRYCGEYFDTETGTYYLRARYYDPAIGRFTQEDTHWNVSNRIYGDNPQKINQYEDPQGLSRYTLLPQSAAITQSGNLYVYCVNNPILYADPTGKVIGWIIVGAIVGGVISGGLDIAGQLISGVEWSSIDWKSVAISGGFGAVSGAFGASTIGWAGQIVMNAVLSGTESVVRDVAYGDSIDWVAAAKDTGIGALAAGLGGPGLQSATSATYYRFVSAGGEIGVYRLTFKSSRIAQTLAKEFIKGVISSTGIDIIITVIDNVIQIEIKQGGTHEY